VLEDSDASKFSQHVIVQWSGNTSLGSIAQAEAVCMHVITSMPHALSAVRTAAGAAGCIIDQVVYNRHQQLRVKGCVKLGSSRVLHVVQPPGCSLDDSLVCLPQQGCLFPGNSTQSKALQRAAATGPENAGSNTLHALVLREISSGMSGCSIIGCALHATQASSHPSIYIYTTSTACAHTQHKSNRALAELDCASMRWRVLCRFGCRPGAWQQLAAGQVPAQGAPAWLQAYCARWHP